MPCSLGATPCWARCSWAWGTLRGAGSPTTWFTAGASKSRLSERGRGLCRLILAVLARCGREQLYMTGASRTTYDNSWLMGQSICILVEISRSARTKTVEFPCTLFACVFEGYLHLLHRIHDNGGGAVYTSCHGDSCLLSCGPKRAVAVSEERSSGSVSLKNTPVVPL